MEGLRQEAPQYDTKWFKERAVSGLRPIDEHSWDYSDSLLLYLPGSDDKYEAVQEVDTPYHRLITVPERASLKDIAPTIARDQPAQFEYIDLGPGTEHKEQFLFDAFKEEGKRFVYRPVDISDRYLRLAKQYASDQGIAVDGLHSSFEELPSKLGESENPRFVSLGLTYSNYDPEEILPLLMQLAGDNGSAFINAQIRERTDMDALREIYREVAHGMTAAKLKLLGIDIETDISSTEVTDEVKVWQVIKEPTPALEERGIKAGDRLLVFQSLRPSLEKLQSDISEFSPNAHILDRGESFVGVLLK